jgi:hypothetical protein
MRDRKYKRVREFTVKLERGGEIYEGWCTLTGQGRKGSELWVQVRWNDHSESTHLGGLEPEVLAKMLLGEMVTKFGKKG